MDICASSAPTPFLKQLSMSLRCTTCILAAAVLASTGRSKEPAPQGPGEAVSPADERIHYEGRLDWADPKAPTMSFPGCAIVVRFEGSGFDARMDTTIADHVQVVVDGRPTQVIALVRTPEDYPVARDLPAGTHTAALFKATETNRGTLQFFGLHLQTGTSLLPVPKPARMIEFIGDSITCGYGDMASSRFEPVSPANSNWYYTFGSITAAHFGADESTVAVSGIRLTQEGDWPAMPIVYTRVHSYDGGVPWDATKGPMPDVVVIDLSTNDFRKTGPDEKTWVDTYLAFIAHIRESRPSALIFLADGPMMPAGPDLDHVRAWNREVVARRIALGDVRCRVFSFDIQSEADGFGSDFHPNVRTHAKMADKLIAAIGKETGW
jgi:lysophospholipase L1-like esterase